MPGAFDIRRFTSTDQAAAAELIYQNLAKRFDALDESRNPDLQDIGRSYADDVFLVACRNGSIIATGALVQRHDMMDSAQIVRMHTRTEHQNEGIGRAILGALEACARKRGFTRVVLETNTDWVDAVRFYCRNGYAITELKHGETYFSKMLVSESLAHDGSCPED